MKSFTITWKGYIHDGSIKLVPVSGVEQVEAATELEALQCARNQIISELQGGLGYALSEVNIKDELGQATFDAAEVTQFLSSINAEGRLQRDSLIKPSGFVKEGNRVGPIYSELFWEGRANDGTKEVVVNGSRRVEAKPLLKILNSCKSSMRDDLLKNGERFVLDFIIVKDMQIMLNTNELYDFFASFNEEGRLEPLPNAANKPIRMISTQDGKKIFPIR